eukprot:246453_1
MFGTETSPSLTGEEIRTANAAKREQQKAVAERNPIEKNEADTAMEVERIAAGTYVQPVTGGGVLSEKTHVSGGEPVSVDKPISVHKNVSGAELVSGDKPVPGGTPVSGVEPVTDTSSSVSEEQRLAAIAGNKLQRQEKIQKDAALAASAAVAPAAAHSATAAAELEEKKKVAEKEKGKEKDEEKEEEEKEKEQKDETDLAVTTTNEPKPASVRANTAFLETFHPDQIKPSFLEKLKDIDENSDVRCIVHILGPDGYYVDLNLHGPKRMRDLQDCMTFINGDYNNLGVVELEFSEYKPGTGYHTVKDFDNVPIVEAFLVKFNREGGGGTLSRQFSPSSVLERKLKIFDGKVSRDGRSDFFVLCNVQINGPDGKPVYKKDNLPLTGDKDTCMKFSFPGSIQVKSGSSTVRIEFGSYVYSYKGTNYLVSTIQKFENAPIIAKGTKN